LEKALGLNAKDPAVYNNLANIYGHTGPVKKAFEFYAKAIELNPREPVYYHNFGTTVYLFRTDAKEFYGITEQQVFDKALGLYSNAMKFDPTNFPSLPTSPKLITALRRSGPMTRSRPGLMP